MTEAEWQCPVCGSGAWKDRFRRRTGTGGGVLRAGDFSPSAELFGVTSGRVVRCCVCGHGSLLEQPAAVDLLHAYEDVADPVSLREEEGQVETARRALARVERFVPPGDAVDLGCWTGSFLVAAKERGWRTVGVEPSGWAAARARERGIDVREADLFESGLAPGAFDLVVLCDVLEHLVDPRQALRLIAGLLRPGGAVYITIPNAGSAVARALGRRWWSVLPMHVQYFTPASVTTALVAEGFAVRNLRSHAKAFTARYYAERLRGYSDLAGRAAVAAVERAGVAERMVAPDFRDRLQVIATRA